MNLRYNVLFYHVTVSTLLETVVVVLSREQQCFTLSDVLSNDNCESFMISATANNSIGTSQVSFLNGGNPFMIFWLSTINIHDLEYH